MTLSSFILRDMEAILAEWEKFARSIPAAAGMDKKALRDHAEKMLRAISKDLTESQTAAQQSAKSKGDGPVHVGKDTAATSHGTDRYAGGFDLTALVSEYRALRATVVRLWTKESGATDREEQLSRFHEAIDQALHESVVQYTGEVNRSRELFMGVLGHDLRNPLGACLVSAQYLLQSPGLSGAQIKAAAAILRSGTRIRRMADDLLDVTRTRFGGALPIEPRPLELDRVCRHVIQEAQAFHPDCSITLAATGDLRGRWDEVRLYQLLSNLVENAVRHGAAGKPVDISASGDDEHVVVAVHNEGTPIARSDLEEIFEPLRQSGNGAGRSEGLGLGLYIARAIVNAHHGAIDVASAEDTGTVFTVRLPREAHFVRDDDADAANGLPARLPPTAADRMLLHGPRR